MGVGLRPGAKAAGRATDPLPATRLPSTLHEWCWYPYVEAAELEEPKAALFQDRRPGGSTADGPGARAAGRSGDDQAAGSTPLPQTTRALAVAGGGDLE